MRAIVTGVYRTSPSIVLKAFGEGISKSPSRLSRDLQYDYVPSPLPLTACLSSVRSVSDKFCRPRIDR